MAITVDAVARRPILGDMALRYKRNTMVLALIIAAIHWTPYVNFDQLNIFGVQIGTGAGSRRFLALLVLWVAFIYTAAWCAYYCWLDWRQWLSDLLQRREHYFPEWAMFWDALPSEAIAKELFNPDGFAGWERKDDAKWTAFLRKVNTGHGVHNMKAGFSIPRGVVAEVREGYRTLQVQLVTAGVCAAAATAGLVWETARLVAGW
jgi:hypothetical protein